MSLTQHYGDLFQKSRNSFSNLTDDQICLTAFTKAHNTSADYGLLRQAIDGRPEAEMLSYAIREYNFAIYAAAAGNYRHATISLRLFLELALASIHFSAFELRLRRWITNEQDIVWAALLDDGAGVFDLPLHFSSTSI